MKKIIVLLLSFMGVLIPINAQFSTNDISVKASQIGETLTDIDEVIIFNGILPTTTISYSHTAIENFKWYRYLTTPTSNDLLLTENSTTTTTLSIFSNSPSIGYSGNGDACGYILEYTDGPDTKYKYIWVLDLANNNIVLGPLTADTIGVDPCVSTHLTTDIGPLSYAEQLEYRDSLGVLRTIPRKFTITYSSLDSLNNNTQITIEKTNIVQGNNDIIVASPYKTTIFTLEGDQFFKSFGAVKTIPSVNFTPVAVQSNLKAVIAERSDRNEKDRTLGALGGSAPLVIDFTSNANEPVAQYYEWYITNSVDSTDVVYYTDKNLRYTFKKAGLYNIKLVVSNLTCIVEDSIDATVLESFLEVPNVFTPNGDDKNDEFRVAFKSIVKFRGIIFNRWGRKVFEWTDPGKGWDGRIGGRMAQPGAYYYIIEAQGSDIDPFTKRPIQYIEKGDINLLRGK